MLQDAVQVKQEGLSNLEQARKIESEQMQREQGIQERLQSLRAMERQIAKVSPSNVTALENTSHWHINTGPKCQHFNDC